MFLRKTDQTKIRLGLSSSKLPNLVCIQPALVRAKPQGFHIQLSFSSFRTKILSRGKYCGSQKLKSQTVCSVVGKISSWLQLPQLRFKCQILTHKERGKYLKPLPFCLVFSRITRTTVLLSCSQEVVCVGEIIAALRILSLKVFSLYFP